VEVPSTRPASGRIAFSGVTAGAASSLAFAALHHVMISDIWFSVVPLMVAGALCGVCLAWTYGRIITPRVPLNWFLYNLLFVAGFLALGLASVLFFEPVTTIPALVAADEPPHELIGKAMPLTVAFTVFLAGLLSVLGGRNLMDFVAIAVTCVVLVALLGLNVSVLGLVSIERSAVFLIVELFALILFLSVVYAFVFWALERGFLFKPAVSGPLDGSP
jgi:hypothetical protein